MYEEIVSRELNVQEFCAARNLEDLLSLNLLFELLYRWRGHGASPADIGFEDFPAD